jgi:tetratricopeptide (TPR) repeat protein
VDTYTECVKKLEQLPSLSEEETKLLSIVYCNRALSYFKLEEYANSESDCVNSLNLNKDGVKALFRLGMAQKSLKKYKAAFETFTHLSKLEENPATKQELEKVTKIIVQNKIKAKQEMVILNSNTPGSRTLRSSRRRSINFSGGH